MSLLHHCVGKSKGNGNNYQQLDQLVAPRYGPPKGTNNNAGHDKNHYAHQEVRSYTCPDIAYLAKNIYERRHNTLRKVQETITLFPMYFPITPKPLQPSASLNAYQMIGASAIYIFQQVRAYNYRS